ncbi:uncharacterized protein [Centruroides vittatus]|uniref:uncharacterized protein n=1 Tax=Centruroides vittatus TaxID=120091 RepID=UPI00350F63B5
MPILVWTEVAGRQQWVNLDRAKINENGLRLLSFATSNSLIIGNTWFQHPLKHQLTWRNPSGKDSAVLDYVLINHQFHSMLKDVQSMRGPDCGSDHYLVRAKIQLKLQRTKQTSPSQPQPDWKQLMVATCRQEFQTTLSNRFSILDTSDEINEEERWISEVILDCSKPLCPPVRWQTQPWISDKCLNLVAKQKQTTLTNVIDFATPAKYVPAFLLY